MLRYGIGALLIVLIITITLSYYYNVEGFAAPTPAKAVPNSAATTAATEPTVSSLTDASIAAPIQGPVMGVTSSDDTAVIAVPAPTKKEIAITTRKIGTFDKRPASTNDKPNNIDNNRKIDKVNVKKEYSGDFLRIMASMPSLLDPEGQIYWVISGNPQDPPIWENVVVTNDENYESAIIPPENYLPYIGQIVYLVPRGSTNRRDALTSFTVPKPSKPTVVNPKVSLSDTGYEAMKLNKQSNLLNDIQKIIHNEMLSHRTLDVSVKNSSSRPNAAAMKATPTPMGAASVTAKKKGMNVLSPASSNSSGNASCNSSGNASCDSSAQCGDNPDMSKYIRKDQIPCYGCSLDY